MTLTELLAHYAAQPDHTTTTEAGPDGRPWHTVTDEDGVLIDWFPTEPGEPPPSPDPAQPGKGKARQV